MDAEYDISYKSQSRPANVDPSMPPLVSPSGNLAGFEVGEVDKHLYASTLRWRPVSEMTVNPFSDS
jgi:hypothetical protein